MSAPADAPPTEKPSGSLTKLVRRATKVLTSRRNSLSSSAILNAAAAEPAPAATSASTSTPTTASAVPAPKHSNPAPTINPSPIEPPLAKPSSVAKSTTAFNALQESKARAIFEKWGLSLDSAQTWRPQSTSTTTAQPSMPWVEKPVRQRVHRQCHRCSTTFARDRICTQCDQKRCKKCPRVPVPREKGKEKEKEKVVLLVDAGAGARAPKLRSKVLGKPVLDAAELSLVRKTPMQRARRSCHRCETLFVGRAVRCENCAHERCAACPRSPPKLDKHPTGYPGDVAETFPLSERIHRHPRTRTRWTCHSCETFFLDHERECRNCGHGRCAECTRIPPVKVVEPGAEEEMDAEVRRLVGRMGGLGVGRVGGGGGNEVGEGAGGVNGGEGGAGL